MARQRSEHGVTRHCAKAPDGCPVTFWDSGQWSRTKAHNEGWFFSYRAGDVFCPAHVPEWVPAWRARKAAEAARKDDE